MLLIGMRATKKYTFAFVLFICICLLIVSLSVIIKLYNEKHYHEPKLYCDKILSLIEKSKTLTISDVFDFDFDKAYISDAIYGDEEYFLKELNVNTSINIPTLESGVHNRILFIKDDMIIYDFVYEMYEIPFDEKGIWIFPNTKITAEENKIIVLH